ncbi:hypothetical protein [Aquimarina algiphila]|uniref:TonB-dependent receptor plug domain-containing protein n=1 Tax=Aquimarina algiphila TaxID=2047982 RepID=A0A554VG34_9FLAO|nr:hypothetical protein [Aquimarina algiphila]TSE06296.1 hypothetical protein FOF46_20130 [Aquimarina algiphila]
MKRQLFTVISFLFVVSLSAQETLQISPEEANAQYFDIPRETVYVHLNKSTYLHGEEIWFKEYTYDRKNNLPSRFTTNLNVELFDDKGNEVYSGLFLGYYGSTQGNIKIDSTWASGNYYLRASTNWMNNFIEDDSYVQKISIVNKSINETTNQQEEGYDFQLLPEGGYMVSDTENTIGFKLINNRGYGVSFDNGSILDDQGIVVGSFKSNQFGIGKFKFKPRSGIKYTAVLVLDNKSEIKVPFPQAESKGIAIRINNLYEDNVIIEFNTNANTVDALKDNNYYLLIHKNNASKRIAINFSPGQISKAISIQREELYSGVNTITLFKDNTPILERLLFNRIEETYTDIEVTYLKTINDSLLLNVKAPQRDNIVYNLSVSVLPGGTKSYTHQDNIHSAMLLNPYIKGFVENPKYYFPNKSTRRKAYDLDLLLITQGWSRYNWNTIFNQKPKKMYDFNNGLTLKGKLQNTKNKDIKQVYLYPTKKNTSRLIDVDSEGSFTIKNFYPEKGEVISISAVKSNGKFVKEGTYIQIQSNRLKKPLVLTASNININERGALDVLIPEYFFDDAELLDEVIIQGRKRQEEVDFDFLKGKPIQISEKERDIFINITDYLTQVVGIRLNLNTDTRTTSGLPPDEFSGIPSNPNAPVVYVDDIQLIDISVLLSIRTRDVENVYYDRFGSGIGGGVGGNGVIRIYSKKTFSNTNSVSSGLATKLSEYTTKKGFQPIKEFYNPIYTSYQDPFFRDFGTIHWQPYINFDSKGVATLKIPDTFTKNIRLFIEGMGTDGSLISKMEMIELE